MTAPTAGYPMCGDRLASCVCHEPHDHIGPHIFGDAGGCGGKWTRIGETTIIVDLPRMFQ